MRKEKCNKFRRGVAGTADWSGWAANICISGVP